MLLTEETEVHKLLEGQSLRDAHHRADRLLDEMDRRRPDLRIEVGSQDIIAADDFLFGQVGDDLPGQSDGALLCLL